MKSRKIRHTSTGLFSDQASPTVIALGSDTVVSLQDLIREAPRVLDFLPKEALTSLLASSSSLRQLVHGHATAVTVVDVPQPSTDQTLSTVKLLVQGNWSRLRKLTLRFSHKETSYWHAVKATLTAECISQLIKGVWPALESVDLSWNLLEAPAVAELVKAEWPSLTTLNLTGTMIHIVAVQHLVTASKSTLQNLRSLDLSSNSLGRAALEALAGNKWTQLSCFSFRNNLSWLDPHTVGYLSKANFTALETLDLAGTSLTVAAVAQLVSAEWPLLRHLRLAKTSLNADTIAQLMKGDWHQLRSLDVSSNDLDAAALQALYQGNWHLLESFDIRHTFSSVDKCRELANLKTRLNQMRSLYLTSCDLSVEAVTALFQGNWTSLQHLYLGSNKVTPVAMGQLLQTKALPLLELLYMPGNGHPKNTVMNLIAGHFPLLKVLDMTGNCLSAPTLRILNEGQWPFFCRFKHHY